MNKIKHAQKIWAAEKQTRELQTKVDNYRIILKASKDGTAKVRAEKYLLILLADLEKAHQRVALYRQQLENSV